MLSIKQHDTAPDLSITLTDNGAVVDLTTATSIKVIASSSGTILFRRDAATGTSLGVVTMPWQATDTLIARMLDIEVEVTWNPSAIQTFPGDGYLRVNVERDLG